MQGQGRGGGLRRGVKPQAVRGQLAMRFLIYGTGAVGAYLGSRLLLAGHAVTFLARPHWAETLRRQGLGVLRGTEAQTIPVTDVLTDLPHGFHLGGDSAILLTVKAFDCASAAEAIRQGVRGDTPVVCLLNGIGNEETLARSIGPDRVVAASLTTAVAVAGPGVIRVERERGLGLGRSPESEPIAAAARHAGIDTRLYEDAAAMKWSKLPTNILANASSAILGWTAGRAMAHRGVYRLEVEALREAFTVMRRLGLRPVDLPGLPVRWLARAVFLPPRLSQPWLSRAAARGRGDKRPSFHQDIGRRRSEVSWLNGAVVAAGETTRVSTPANILLLKVMLDLVEGRSDPTGWRDRPDRLMARARQERVPGLH